MNDAEYKVGQLYKPTHLYDYGGNLFWNQGCKLVQHEVLNMDHQLIPPWEQYATLWTGTLIMATVTLHCFNESQGFTRQWNGQRMKGDFFFKDYVPISYFCHKIYQINFHHLLVIDDSIADIETRNVHPGYGLDEEVEAEKDTKDSSADHAISSFKVKRIKLNNEKSATANISNQPTSVADSASQNTEPTIPSSSMNASQSATSKTRQSTKGESQFHG